MTAVQTLAPLKLLLAEHGLPCAMNGADERGDPARESVFKFPGTLAAC